MYNKLTEKDGDIFVDNIDITKNFSDYNGKDIVNYGYSYGLVSSLYCENMSDIRYIKELISRKVDCNFPLLVCDCDLDFSCTVVVVKVKFDGDCVKWKKIGIVSKDRRTFFENYRNSGIRRVEDWNDDYWENTVILRTICLRTIIFSMTGAVSIGRKNYTSDTGDIIINVLTMTAISAG